MLRAILAFLLLAGPATALAPGATTRVAVAGVPEQSYELYLPAGYDADERWPVLYLLDARGRGTVPLEIFRPAAERLGFVLASSNDSASDTAVDRNLDVAWAMMQDTWTRLAVDPKRLYIAGFSGTARSAWKLGYGLKDLVAGVIGCGAGLPQGPELLDDVRFVYSGIVGSTDFNWEEMIRLDERLDEVGVTHRLELFDGGHAWPPVEVATHALEWLDLQAMRQGRRTVDDGWIDARLKERQAVAERLEADGDVVAAHAAHAAIVADFEGLRDVAASARARDRLADHPARRSAAATRREILDREARFRSDLAAVAQALRTPQGPPMTAAVASRRLDLEGLQATAAEEGSTEQALLAQRLLAKVFVQTSFYLPRELRAAGSPLSAATSLEIAAAITPNATVLYNLGCAYALAGRERKAIEAIEEALDAGFADRELLLSDEDLVSVRDRPDFRRLADRLRGLGTD